MALANVAKRWAHQLTTGESTSFVIETTALASVTAILSPVFRFMNLGNEAAEIQIVYTANFGTANDDPLNSGTYSNTVVDVSVPAGTMYTYDFGGIPLGSSAAVTVTHEVTITNPGLSTHIFQSVLFGSAEIQMGLSIGQMSIS